jgi:hypothetical protein
VGFDQTLNMLAEIPIADDWIAGSPYLAGLKGQSISIPIRGTISKPIFDTRSIQQLSTQLAKQAASGAFNQAIAEKVTPELEKIQNQVNNKLGGEINKLQNQFGEKLGGFLPSQNTGTVPPAKGTSPATGGATPDVGKQLEGELMKGLDNLFGGKR